MILGVGGNLLVLIVIFFHQQRKTVTSFFIINLAISDLIFAIFCIPATYLTAYILQYWPFGSFACVFFNYMQTVSVTLTIYILIWITFDKYWAFVNPFKLRMSISVCKYLIFISWLFSFIVSSPIALTTKLIYTSKNISNITVIDYDRPNCVEQWPEKLFAVSEFYNIGLLLIQYLIPLVILAYCYIRIYFALMRPKSTNELVTLKHKPTSNSKRKVSPNIFLIYLI